MFLLGPPGPARRHLASAFCELTRREVEYVSVSRTGRTLSTPLLPHQLGGDKQRSDASVMLLSEQAQFPSLAYLAPNPRPFSPSLSFPFSLSFSLLFLSSSLATSTHQVSRDTTEADLKQRRELGAGGSSAYADAAPVRAALHGRVLLLDGLEKAERNVLPTLNNLLENREMALDDGRLLVSETGRGVERERKGRVGRRGGG